MSDGLATPPEIRNPTSEILFSFRNEPCSGRQNPVCSRHSGFCRQRERAVDRARWPLAGCDGTGRSGPDRSLRFPDRARRRDGTVYLGKPAGYGVPLDKVEYSASTIHWVLGSSLIFDGTVSPQAIAGTFQEGPGRGTFSLKRARLDPAPYRREAVTFPGGPGVFFGTLFCVAGAGGHPGIVFLHGGGPATRWGKSFFFAYRVAPMWVAG